MPNTLQTAVPFTVQGHKGDDKRRSSPTGQLREKHKTRIANVNQELTNLPYFMIVINFRIEETGSEFHATERNRSAGSLSIRTFTSRRDAQRWVLGRLDTIAAVEQAQLRDQMNRHLLGLSVS